MAKNNKNSCQINNRISKKTVLAYLGIYDLPESPKEFDEEFDESFAVGKNCSARSVPSNATAAQKLFYKMCIDDWDIVSFDSISGEVCIFLNKAKTRNVITLNVKKDKNY